MRISTWLAVLVGFSMASIVHAAPWWGKVPGPPTPMNIADQDGDGVLLAADNCPFVANPTQGDKDADGKGDVCDNCPSIANGNQSDGDQDGDGDLCDNCVAKYNPLQSDDDYDGPGTECDNCPNHFNPFQADADSDGVGNPCESCLSSPAGNACTAFSVGSIAVGDQGAGVRQDLTVWWWNPATTSQQSGVQPGAVFRMSGLTGIAKLVQSGETGCALRKGVAAWCWDNKTESPKSVAVSHIKDIAASTSHRCVVDDDGRAWCWGDNHFGQLGDGKTTDQSNPVPVPGANRYIQITVGLHHSCALRKDRTVWCWGKNTGGRLGVDSNKPVESLPRQVKGLNQVVSIAALNVPGETLDYDGLSTCALMKSTGVMCWGDNTYGQLGNGSELGAGDKVKQITPQYVYGDMVHVVGLSAGARHVCAVRDDLEHALWCWGANESGQLGNNTLELKSYPQQVVDTTPIVAVSAGTNSTCGLRGNGEVICWGGYTDMGDTILGSLIPQTVIFPEE